MRVRGQLLAWLGGGDECEEGVRGRGGVSLEVQVLEGEVRLHNAGGLHPGPQDVLLCGDVGGLGYPVQVVQVAASGRKRGN